MMFGCVSSVFEWVSFPDSKRVVTCRWMYRDLYAKQLTFRGRGVRADLDCVIFQTRSSLGGSPESS